LWVIESLTGCLLIVCADGTWNNDNLQTNDTNVSILARSIQQRIADVSDEMELDEVYSTEQQLLYVVATRARDRFLISGVAPGSQLSRVMSCDGSRHQSRHAGRCDL
jgi:hypothetical protein